MATGKIPGGHEGSRTGWQPPPPDFKAMGKQLTDAVMPGEVDGAVALVASAGADESATSVLDRFFEDPANAETLSLLQRQRSEIVWTFGADSPELAAFDEGVLQTAREGVASYAGAAALAGGLDLGPIDPNIAAQVAQEPAAAEPPQPPRHSPEAILEDITRLMERYETLNASYASRGDGADAAALHNTLRGLEIQIESKVWQLASLTSQLPVSKEELETALKQQIQEYERLQNKLSATPAAEAQTQRALRTTGLLIQVNLVRLETVEGTASSQSPSLAVQGLETELVQLLERQHLLAAKLDPQYPDSDIEVQLAILQMQIDLCTQTLEMVPLNSASEPGLLH